MLSVSWLHISDFHFQATGDKFSQEQACKALLESVEAAVTQGEEFAFAAVTGDIAFSGQEAEYKEARTFLDQLVETTGLKGSDFYFVPGNHDVDRGLGELAYHGGRSDITSPESVDYYLADPDRISGLILRQGAYRSFVEEFTAGQHRIPTPDGLAYVSKLNLHPVTVCILGLNSAWLSGSNEEYGRLVVGERQMINAITEAKSHNPHYIIALAHHPMSWLTEWDANSCATRLLPAADFFLRGHLHLNRVSLNSSPSEPCIEIAAGSGHATRFYGNSYNRASIDLSRGSCTIQAYTYDPANDRYEASEPVVTEVVVPGSIPGTRTDLAEAIGLIVPEAMPFCGFMAGLLTNELGEVPIPVDGKVSFVLPSAARYVVGGEVLDPMKAFLELRNLLRLGDQNVSLDNRVLPNASAILDYANSLGAMATRDPTCLPRLQGHLQRSSKTDSGDTRPWSLGLLNDLRRENDWDGLEAHSRRLVLSTDQSIRRYASAGLAEALLHSDESQKRREAFDIASQLALSPDAWDSDVVLASAAAEVCDDDRTAIELLCNALKLGRRSIQLISHARDLSIRCGNKELRILVENARSDATERGQQ